MTREEAVEILQGAIKKPNTKDGYLGQALDMAIKALEQEPCEDTVSRKAVDQNIYDYAESNGLSYANLKNAILDTPSVTPTRKEWIPVSERLPEENGGYLVTVMGKYITTALWVGNAENWSKITAWMQLPEPYGEGEEKEHKALSEWQQDHAILKAHADGANEVIDRVKQAREEIKDMKSHIQLKDKTTNEHWIFVDKFEVLAILEKLIAEVEGTNERA